MESSWDGGNHAYANMESLSLSSGELAESSRPPAESLRLEDDDEELDDEELDDEELDELEEEEVPLRLGILLFCDLDAFKLCTNENAALTANQKSSTQLQFLVRVQVEKFVQVEKLSLIHI